MKFLSRFAWLAVVVCALTLSNWSLLYVGHHYGLPVLLAAILSVSLDGAALVCADISLKYAREHGASGAAPRFAVLIIAGISSWLNSEHASMLREGIPAHVMFAAPPVIALVLFELHTRWERRDALRAAGRLSEPLPVFGAFVWLLHLFGAYLAVWRVTGARLAAKTEAELQRWNSAATLPFRPGTGTSALAAGELHPWNPVESARTKTEAIRVAMSVLGDVGAPDIVAWLAERGWHVDAGHVRSVKARSNGNGHATPTASVGN